MATGHTRFGSVTAYARKSTTPCRERCSFFTSHPSLLSIDDNGKAELYDDDYNITIFCKDEQEQQRAMKRLETANRMRWHDAKTDPPEDSRDVIVYRDGIGSVMGFFDHEIHKRWLDANTCAFLDDVTHWMEKPEDPEKTEEGDPE